MAAWFRFPYTLTHTLVVATVTLLLGIPGCAPPTKTTETIELKQYDAATFFETTQITGASFSEDESKILFSSDATGVFNVYSVSLDDNSMKQLTHSDTDSMFAVTYFPEDDRFLFTADQGGNELNHLYVHDSDGTERDLTPGDNLKASFAGFSDDHRAFWVMTNERDPQFFDLYEYSVDGYERRLRFQNTEGWAPSGISRNGRWLALSKVINNADTNLYLADLEAGSEPKLVTEHEGWVEHQSLGFTPDSTSLLYLTDGPGEFKEAWSYRLDTDEHIPLLKADWDVMYVAYSKEARYRVSAVNADARSELSIYDTLNEADLSLPELPEGDITGVTIAPSETKMAFYVNSDTSPSNLHFLDLEADIHRELTATLNPEIQRADLVDGDVIRYPSFDGMEIPALLYRPQQASAVEQVPALVWVHGGPGGQSRKGYRAAIQHLVNQGYAILAVNNRGSSGYGKTFYHLDDRKHGDVDLKDCVWARKYLESLNWVEGSKVGIIGGSYGGYMVAAALAFEPDAFELGIDIFGVTNWVRTLESIPPWWTSARDSLYAELGDPATDEDRLRSISPLFHASNITKPLLVVQGANDPRVLQVESDELVEAAKSNGVAVEYIVFPDEGHGFRRKANRIEASERYVRFLDRHLRGTRIETTE